MSASSTSAHTIRDHLTRSPLGRSILATLCEPTPNGDILELTTAPVRAETVGAVKQCLGETGEEFGRRFGMTMTVANYVCRDGITEKALAAQFRLIVAEGMCQPDERPEVGRREVFELVEICGGTSRLAAETDMCPSTVRSWKREGIPSKRSRWPYVFAMVVPHLFDQGGRR